LPATTVCVHTAQTLASTGVQSIDHIIGGGVSVGSILLVEEDAFVTYSNFLLNTFLAEGYNHDHDLIIVDLSKDSSHPIKLPKKCETTSKHDEEKQADRMSIAWRYTSNPLIDSELGDCRKQYYFDVLENSCQTEESKSIWRFGINDCLSGGSSFQSVKIFIENLLKDQNVDAHPRLFRLCIYNFASVLWNSSESDVNEAVRFLTWLRSAIKSKCVVAIISIPSGDLPSFVLKRFRHLSDCCLHLNAFSDHENGDLHPASKEYHGLFELHKLPSTNRLFAHVPETFDLVFRIKRKGGFVVEKWHLPPEFGETQQREQDDVMGCSTAMKAAKLDF